MKRLSVMICAILVVAGLTAMSADKEEKSLREAKERKAVVQPSDLPANIKKAIEEAVPKGEVVRIYQEVAGKDPGQYDVDVRSEGKLFEVEISPKGKVLEVKEVKFLEEMTKSGLEKKWTRSFGEENRTFSPTGENRFFILKIGHQLVLESPREKVVITVLDETKKVGDILTRVVEEREWLDGELKEVSRNFFAQCKEHGDVFYFGEEVDDYEDGKIVRHSGEWRADEEDSKAGIMMPGTILLGARHYQEIAPAAMDRAEIIRMDITMKTPAGTFENCIRVEESSPLEPGDLSLKTYAPGVGVIQDEDLLLTGWTKAKK